MNFLERFVQWVLGWHKLSAKPPKPPLPIQYRVLKVKHKKKKNHKARKCPTTDKICRSEHGAKGRANSVKLPKLRAYKCAFCNSWHLTHKKNKLTFH